MAAALRRSGGFAVALCFARALITLWVPCARTPSSLTFMSMTSWWAQAVVKNLAIVCGSWSSYPSLISMVPTRVGTTVITNKGINYLKKVGIFSKKGINAMPNAKHMSSYVKLFNLQDNTGKPTPEQVLFGTRASHGNTCPQINHYSVQVLERGCPWCKIRGTSTTNPTSQALNMFETFVLQELWKVYVGLCSRRAIHSRRTALFIFVKLVSLAMSNIQAHLLQHFQQVHKEYFSKLFANFWVSQNSVPLGVATILRGSSLAATLWGWKAAKLPARLLWIQVSIKGKEINIRLVGTQQKSLMKTNTDEPQGNKKEMSLVHPPCHAIGGVAVDHTVRI